MATTSDRLLRGVKRRVTMPASNQLLKDADLLELADDCMRDRLTPLMKALDGNYMLTTPTTTPLVAGQDTYDIPYRAVGRKMRNLKISPDGTAESIYDLTLLDDDKIQLYAVSGVPAGFYYVGDRLVVRPKPTDTVGYLELWWYLQASQIVATSAAAMVVAAPVAGVVLVNQVPSTMAANVAVDFIQGKSGNRVLGMDAEIAAVAPGSITFASADVPAELAVGDWIALSQQTPVLQICDEAVPLLETAICERALYANGDYDGAKKLRDEDLPEEEKNLRALLDPRTDQAPIKFVNTNGLLRRRTAWPRRGLYF